MSSEFSKKVNEAINKSLQWSENGWKITFGRNEVPVNSLKDAESLPNQFVYKLEAVYYWKRVKEAGQEAAQYGEKARNALENGDKDKAVDALYAARFIETPYKKYSNTWEPVYKAINN